MKVVIIGVGTQAMVVADIVAGSNNFSLAGFIGNEEEAERLSRTRSFRDVPFLGDHKMLPKLIDHDIAGFVVAVGDNAVRENYFFEASSAGLFPVNAISRKAIMEDTVTLGAGCVVSPGVVLSHGVTLGDNVIVDPGVT